jgi:hypothetical protein
MESVTGPDASKSARAYYEQIDTIRFLTISIIVWSHSLFSVWHSGISADLPGQLIKIIVIQAGAISTVTFFIVSGILMHSKLHAYNLRTYFKERIPRIYAPWLFIVCFNAVLIFLHRVYLNQIQLNRDYKQLIHSGYDIFSGLLIYGPYWFVVTYFAGMVVLICFKRYSSNVYFGLLLIAITLFYSINFHFSWIDTLHTKAVFAYTFFIWLGFRIHKRWTEILRLVERIDWLVLIPFLLILFSITCYEGYSLSKAGVRDAFASNRLSNIIFSLLFFLALLKLGAINRINRLQPRKIVYGIYLINSIVVLELTLLFSAYLKALATFNVWTLLGLQLLYFSVVLFLTCLIVNYLANSKRLNWIIGGQR